jgi:hypothetical protein
VVAETSHPRTIEQLVSTPIRYSCAENLLAAAGGACNRGWQRVFNACKKH